jgi:hypothetical protein
MNKEMLVQKITGKINNHEIQLNSGNPFLVIKNNNLGIESLEIYDEGHEYTLVIKGFTHCHFNYEQQEEMINYIEDIISSKIAVYCIPNIRGGSQYISDSFKKENNISYYTWSGKI